MECKHCGKEIIDDYHNSRKYCNKFCKNKHHKKQRDEQINKLGYGTKINVGTKGAISEMRVCVDLAKKGYEVFRAISPSCPCDLIVFKNGESKRVEVRSANISYNGKCYVSNTYKLDKNKFDVLAMVYPKEIKYEWR